MTDVTSRLSAAIADRYRIERRLGEGGMATVYLADDLKHGRKVALKVLKPELAAVLGAERFVQEIRTTASLQHPNILPLFDSGEANGFLFYVMPYIEGETLRRRLDRETQLGVEEAVRIATEVAEALGAAHRQDVIHRDIKPENILLHDGRPLVADFGIALAVSAAAGGRMTETGLSLGTPHYMSPEQATAEKEITHRSDIYSLGSVLYEMLAGTPPHTGGSAQQIIMKIVTEAAQPVTDVRRSVPPHVGAAVAKSLEKLPADRFESTSKFVDALHNPGFTVATVPTFETRSAPRVVWSRLTVVTSVLAVIFAIVAAWALLRPDAAEPVIRYRMVMNPGETLYPVRNGSRVALSPDARRIAFVAPSEQNRTYRLLRIRFRDQLASTELPGTGRAQHVFFSPDGGQIGFLTVSPVGLHVASLGGGPPITLATAGLAGDRSGTWGVDGYLYVMGLAPGRLVRIPAGGGSPESASTLDTARGETLHGWPHALPNGRGLLMTVAYGTGPTEFDIAALDLSTGLHRVLVRGVVAKYARTGHLVYVTVDGTLMAAPFDQGEMVLTGEAIALTQGVGVSAGTGVVDLAMSQTGTLIYTPATASPLLEPVWVTREGNAEPIAAGWIGEFAAPRISPDGSRLALTIFESGQPQIWIRQFRSGLLQKLTFDGDNYRAAWVPDGEQVSFVTNRSGTGQVYTRRIDGTGRAELLLERSEEIWEVTHSDDSRWIVYRVETTNGSDLYAMNVADSAVVPLAVTPFSERLPRVSPDGRWLAYQSDESGQTEVYVRPFPNTNAGLWQVSENGGTEPVWARSGRELFYRSGLDLMSAAVVSGPATFVLGERRTLFSVAGFVAAGNRHMYDVAPDDERFVMIRELPSDEEGDLIVVENFFEELKAKVGNE